MNAEIPKLKAETPARPPEIGIVHELIQRIGARLRPPLPLRCIDEEQVCHHIAFAVADEHDAEILIDRAELLDVSLRGLAFLADGELQDGQVVHMRAISIESGHQLFVERLRISNSSRQPVVNGEKSEMSRFGAASLAERNSRIYQAILDSIFLEQSAGPMPREPT